MISSKKAKIRVPNRLSLPGQNFDSLWGILKDAIDHIYADQVGELSFELLYRTVYTLVLRRKAFELYGHLESYLGDKLDELEQNNLKDVEGFELLHKLFKIWESQCRCFKLISDVMIYMDKVYCKYERKMETYDMGLESFKKHVIDPIMENVSAAMLSDINKVRLQGSLEVPHADTWKGIVGMMETLEDEKDNYFSAHFEPALLQETESYYKNAMNYKELSPVEYLETMKKLKSYEFSLDQKFINADSTVKVTTVLENVLIWTEQFMEAIPVLMRDALTNNNVELLREICSLSSEEKYCTKILDCIKNCIWEDVTSLTVDKNSRKRAQVATQWTTKVIEIYNYYQSLLSTVDLSIFTFEGQDNSSLNVIHEVIGNYLNQDAIQTCEFITLHLDTYAKSTEDKRDINNVKESLEDCVKIFKLISEKDVFESFYKKLMSKRLLHQRSSIKLEKWLVKQIKGEMGTFFTSKLDGMLRDINRSAMLSHSFKPEENVLPNCVFTSQILTMTSWPFQTANVLDENVILPPQMRQYKEEFEIYYNKMYNDRTLRWAHHLGFMEIGFQFKNGYYEIGMPIYGAIVLLLFEEHEELTTEQILELTNMSEQELQRQLISMSLAPKSRILKKKPLSKTISLQDTFSINYGFTSPTQKVRLQTIANITTKSEAQSQAGHDSLEKERVVEVNAAIVRIIKSCKKSAHDQLFQQVSDTLKNRFTLMQPTFKKSLANLLNKEYLQRDSEDTNIYHYIS
ncbi:hypothetical protein ZYGR_0AY02190 [Zygosaccharomyces rouxii]|uniref:Cullin family profile domain-containing protein n=1 Tax=Zygosaccharomyces rouxii TaxID=4956 RepID=A0A1Q3AJB0_ZYGRO|nr:hypothetical protein ZYGR_0AY02190 [Zygosaccharomyces rouxii]